MGVDEVVELQILGGISVYEIDTVVFDFEPPPALTRALRSKNVEWSVNPMPSLPSWLSERFVRGRVDGADDEDEPGAARDGSSR